MSRLSSERFRLRIMAHTRRQSSASLAWMLSLRQELDLAKLTDIYVCTVMPMAMDTPFFDDALN
jgi:hypothetical protein